MNTERLAKLQEMIEQKPGDAFLWYAVALEYAQAGNAHEAIARLMKVLEKFPEYLPAYYQLAQLLENTGQSVEAREVYKQGIVLAEKQNDLKTYRELQTALQLLED